MSTLTIINAAKPFLFLESNRVEVIDACGDSQTTITLTGVGIYQMSLNMQVEPGGGYVRLNTTNPIFNLGAGMVNNVEFYTGWTGDDGGSHSELKEFSVTLNGSETLTLVVVASHICKPLNQPTNSIICWDGSGAFSYPSAYAQFKNENDIITTLTNVPKMQYCDGIAGA